MNEGGLTLRRARPGDEGKLAMLGGATFFAAFAHDHPGDALVAHIESQHSRDYYARALADPKRAAWLLETPLGAPVGYAMLTPPDVAHPTGPDDLELKRIYMLGGWQSGGHGVRLLDAVEQEARLRGAHRLLLCVYTSNPSAQRFYARRGFRHTGSHQLFMVGELPFDDQIWEKDLR